MRRRKAQWLVSGMLSLSLLIVVMGIYTSTRTESISITGYLSGIIVSVIITFWFIFGINVKMFFFNRKYLFLCWFVCLFVICCLFVLCLTMRPNGILDLFVHTLGNYSLFWSQWRFHFIQWDENVLIYLIQSNHYLIRK